MRHEENWGPERLIRASVHVFIHVALQFTCPVPGTVLGNGEGGTGGDKTHNVLAFVEPTPQKQVSDERET